MADRTSSAPKNRALLLKLGAVVVVLGVAAVLVLRGIDVRTLIDRGLELLRAAGPVAFFLGMALAPLAAVPMLAFSLPAVALYGPRFGTPGVVALSLAAVTVNFCLAYGLARRGLRPLLSGIVHRLGYQLPDVEAGDATDLVILLRVTPGVPFFAQNYLAGLAEVPFGRYFLVSALTAWPLNVAFLLFGDALLHGKGKVALISICALAALLTATHLVRKHYERRKKAV
ncbi:TVP38/TMEM64 family protein [Oleiharenicola sp. Vm1]|uniref:TVP38/TMEM64 family protein n=1 Tax=Oleiharenicola sp. Vm1 TaxID=3398393 RepID=UPI0039F50522